MTSYCPEIFIGHFEKSPNDTCFGLILQVDNTFSFETRSSFRYFDIREGGEKGENEECHVLQSSRQERFSFDETKEEFSEINSNHSCIFKTCLRLVGCVICSSKAVAMA